MREGDIYVVLGCCLKSCEEWERFYQQSGRFCGFRSQQSGRFCRFRSQQLGRFCEFRSQQSGRLCKSEVSGQRGLVSLEVSSRGGFGSFEAGWERLCEFSSEESEKSVDVEARSRGESKRPVVE